jgi:deoxycytidine triphosphate deaminase
MVLTSSQFRGKGIVRNPVPASQRPTTYDATVGSIIRCGVELQAKRFVLKPRHIVWIVSAETFAMGDSTTGLATLKTEWTHQGVLALNVGIVDPGWDGPLAAAVVNLSNSDFVIKLGQPFFRILFHDHNMIPANELKKITKTRSEYIKDTISHSKSFASTFLDMEDLSRTVAERVLGMPRWAIVFSVVAIILGLLAISIPVGVSIMMDGSSDKAKLGVLENKVTELQAKFEPQKIDPKTCRPVKIDGRKQLVCPPA